MTPIDCCRLFAWRFERFPRQPFVRLALSQPSILGLSEREAETLRPLTEERYRLIANSKIYANAISALPYCYAANQSTQGLANVYVPEQADATTPVIVFLHGYGGSFLWYQHLLSEFFPDHIIICPAYGISSAAIPADYVRNAIRATSDRLGFAIKSPALMGLSAGGVGACRVYAREPKCFSQLICLAAYPPDDTIARFPRIGSIRFLAGGEEFFVRSSDLQRRIQKIKRSSPRAELALIPDADHYFLLTHKAETLAILQRWVLSSGQSTNALDR